MTRDENQGSSKPSAGSTKRKVGARQIWEMRAPLSVCSRGWAVDLLYAADSHTSMSVDYVRDLRHLVVKRWEQELESIDIQTFPVIQHRIRASKANWVEVAPFADPYGNLHGAEFCLRYGIDGYSWQALNYRNPFLKSGHPRHFLDRNSPLLLGNLAVCVKKSAVPALIYPPPDLLVAGVAELPTASFRSLIVWLGVRYCCDETDGWLRDQLDSLEWSGPLLHQDPVTYVYGSVFSRQFAGDKYDLTREEEVDLRRRMGYPARGKPIREQILYETICTIFGKERVVRRYRGKELQGLELDIWVPHLQLAFEYQGQQHFRRVAHWQSEEAFEKQKVRDTKKAALCKELNVRLVYYGPDDDLSRVAVLEMLRRVRAI
ncbi:TPA: hypothetical protein QDC22_007534 [Burkholderia stabilis]|nr:hypothetical protein [Burkholderia stabilis]HDR9589145.1 hypothetical protein [Burkholderia stabilis]HDR9649541.1 hypothetical protein [Burkholderia stabilis]HDR9653607.1 hypothetical protein [Burkholderia stabilis]HDR9656302.1 hypothetical protein [Burkholderia stabilis]